MVFDKLSTGQNILYKIFKTVFWSITTLLANCAIIYKILHKVFHCLPLQIAHSYFCCEVCHSWMFFKI